MRNVDSNKSRNLVSKKDQVASDSLQWYLAEVGRFNLLSREEEKELAIKFREQGDTNAARVLVTSNLRLVVKIALGYHRAWKILHLLDLIQEGNVGLLMAVNKFDPQRNVKLSSYATFWIKSYITKFITNNRSVVKSGALRGHRKLSYNLNKERQKLIEQGFCTMPKFLSEPLGASQCDTVDINQRFIGWDISLNAPKKDDSGPEKIDFVKTETESVENQVAKKEINDLLHNKAAEFRKKLTIRELEIFDRRIFSDDPATLHELGIRYSITRQRVRQVETIVIRKLKKFFLTEFSELNSLNEMYETREI